MIASDHIITTALLGTDKHTLTTAELPAALCDATEQLYTNQSLDKEELFLQITSLVFNYRQCGIAPLTKENIDIKEAEKENKPYCQVVALQVLSDILEEQSYSLLKEWLQHCEANQQLVPPELIPVLFGIAVNHKKLRSLITACCGKRGEWLSSFNPEWNFYTPENEEEVWQNGTTEQRKKILQTLRETDAAKAREWLQQTWSAENANTKAELLKQLEINGSADDVPWLENLLEEKSQKVKEVVLDLLKKLPSYSVVTSYWNILQRSISLKKEKALLGILNKTSLHIQLTDVDDSIFKTGIEKLSHTKEYTDDEFILIQLMQFVPPQNWEAHFSHSPEQIIGFFQKESLTQKYMPALVKAIIHYKDKNWANAFMQNSDELYIRLLSVLPPSQQDHYSSRFFDKEPAALIQLAKERESEWSLELTKKIFRYTAKNIYQYNKHFYNECIHLIPASIVSELEKCTPAEAYLQPVWSSMSEYIIKLITLKIQTIQAFQS